MLETPLPISAWQPRALIVPSLKDMSNPVKWNYLVDKVIYVRTGPKNISLIAGSVIERAQSLLQNSPLPDLQWLCCTSKVCSHIKMLKRRKQTDSASLTTGKLFLVWDSLIFITQGFLDCSLLRVFFLAQSRLFVAVGWFVDHLKVKEVKTRRNTLNNKFLKFK